MESYERDPLDFSIKKDEDQLFGYSSDGVLFSYLLSPCMFYILMYLFIIFVCALICSIPWLLEKAQAVVRKLEQRKRTRDWEALNLKADARVIDEENARQGSVVGNGEGSAVVEVDQKDVEEVVRVD